MTDQRAETTASRQRPRTALWVAIALGVAIALLVGVLATRDPASTRLVKSPLVGKLVPDISKPSINDEGDFSLREQRGKWVLVNFFATWCVPCQQEHDDLVRFAAAHAERDDATVVSVVFSDETADVRRYFARRGGDWPVLADRDGAIATDFGVARVPESYLVAPNGLVVGKVTGGVQFAFLQAQLAKFERQAAS
jgi:cytochrome c biogenesis protein CcmG, thiol:disulfide interchange protein DsbE